MKNKWIALFLIIITVIAVSAIFIVFFQTQINEPSYKAEVLVENLDTPWAIDFLPDNRMIFTERNGKVSIFDGKNVSVIGNINVIEEGESGLLGIEVDPEFASSRFIYVYYTGENGNRVSRFTLNEKLENEQVLIDNIPGARVHNGGKIKFGPDGKIYITTGDANNRSSAQDINSLAGKILRMNKDGTVPPDNPFENYVYSYGHRNPQGLAWNPENQELYSSEHGPTRNDEINIIVRGGNYGWPLYQCSESPEGFIKPIMCYSDFTLAPAGIAFYNGDLYVAGLRGSQLRKLTLSADGRIITSEEELFTDLGRIRAVVEHDEYIYISTSNRDGRGIPKTNDDKIIRTRL